MGADAVVAGPSQRFPHSHGHGGVARLGHSPGKRQRLCHVERSAGHGEASGKRTVVRELQSAAGVNRDASRQASLRNNLDRREVIEGEGADG